MALQDVIYGREIPTGVRKSQVVIGRGGSGNARKSISSASGESFTSATSTTSSRLLHLGSLMGSRTTHSSSSPRTRRWSSASSDFLPSVINITHEVGDSDRFDLYTISSHSTSTNESGILSDVPSFISEYTFRTSSNPSSKSRPSTMSSNPSRRSGQSDWLARIATSQSSESVPDTISEVYEGNPTPRNVHNSNSMRMFRNPFAAASSSSVGPRQARRHSEIPPFEMDDDDGASIISQQRHVNLSPLALRRFKMFRRGSRTEFDPRHLSPLAPTPFGGTQFGQSNETVNVQTVSRPLRSDFASRKRLQRSHVDERSASTACGLKISPIVIYSGRNR